MKATLILGTLLAAFLVAIPAASAALIQAEFEVDRIQSEGTIQGNASLTAMLHPHQSSQGATLPGFALSAEHLRIEIDYSDVAVVIPGIINDHPVAETFVEHHSYAVASGQQSGAGYRFTAVPDAKGASVSLEAVCTTQQSPVDDEILQPPFVQSQDQRPTTVIEASKATQWEACDGAAVAAIEGDFWFSAWAIDLNVEDSTGRHEYWSGHRDEQPITQDQELYVYVTNGTLRIPLGAASDYALFLSSGSFEVVGSVQLTNAHGSLTTPGSQLDVGGEPVTLDGNLQVGLQSSGTALQVTLTGDSDDAIINGHPVLLTTTAPESMNVSSSWILLVLLGIPAFFAQRRIRATLNFARAKRLTRRRPSDAIHQLNRAIQLRPRWGQAYYHRAYVLTRLGKLQEALADHEAAQQHLDLTDTQRRERNVREAYRTCAKLRDAEGIQHWQRRFQFKLPRYS